MDTPNQVVGQSTPQQQAVAGAGQVANPWAEYGLNPDGTPIQQSQQAAPSAEKATLEAKVADLEAKLARLPEGFEALSKKVALVDKLVGALKGEDAQPESGKLQEIWADLKKVAGSSAPGVERLLNLLEADPQYLDRLESANAALMSQHIIGVNEKAHSRVLDLAKKAGFKAGSENDLTEMVFPFEQSMTMMINANPELRRAYLSGNVGVIDDIFNRLIRPHVAQRLREKQAKTKSAFDTPKAPPRGGSAPASATEDTPKRPNLKTPQGRADFHKQAVARWLDKASNDE